ncbi:MAG: glycosyltransferase family 1 protein [Arenimonas sp.]|jgi:glycosyltransferase involved in cell wall biosynthesis
MKNQLHIELVTETYPPEVNGVAFTVQSLEHGLRALGHRVAVVRTERPEDDRRSNEDRVLIASAPLPNYPGLRFGLPAGRRLLARWKDERPDAIYVATEGPLGWSALNTARKLAIPVATGFHTRFDTYARDYGFGFLSPWVFNWLRRFHNRGDATIVPTLELQTQLQAQGFGKVQRLGRAVDTTQFHPSWRDYSLRESWGLADDDLAVLSVGRLAPEKNLDLTLRAFRAVQAQFPRARLVLVGDGPSRAALQAANPDVIFVGVQRGDALSRHYASCDLFLFSSLSETFGNVTLEAMASGLATVAFDYGAAREHLLHGEHGAVVAFGAEDEFVQWSVRIACKPNLQRLGRSARASVQPLHPLEVAEAFALLLEGLSPQRKAA